jgi:NADH dehydrogenase [ubiquinone] 1 alpha subcomplex assembly factor 5
VVDFGSGAGHLAKAMMMLPQPPPQVDSSPAKKGTPILSDIPVERIQKLVMMDSPKDLLYRDKYFSPAFLERRVIPTLESLPLEDSSVDCVISNLVLHWINDLPGILHQINRCLTPDGLFLAALLGGDTLYELRGSIQLAEQERKGGVAPHISPMAEVKDIGNLLTLANFKLLTIDVEDIVVSYPDVISLLVDLRAAGDSAAHVARSGYLGRDMLLATEAVYRELYGEGEDVPATFHVIFLIGWKEGVGTPRPIERASVKRGFGTVEK